MLKFELACGVVVFAMYKPLPAGKSAPVNALKVGAASIPETGPANIVFAAAVATPVPPCEGVTKALVVKIVVLASGKVYVFSVLVAPANFVYAFPVPPKLDPIT